MCNSAGRFGLVFLVVIFCSFASAEDECTVEANCTGHASEVTFEPPDTCNCTCSKQWTGSQCSECPSKFEQQDCSTCASGFVNYPDCEYLFPPCSVDANCSGRAHSVVNGTPTNSVCICACSDQWTGDTCEVCPLAFNQVSCDACAPIATGDYPNCTANETCTLDDDCAGNADSVMGNRSDAGGCNCTCRNHWESPRCDFCPPRFNASNDCMGCARGHLNYPDCDPDPTPCNVSTDCNDRGRSVTGTRGSGCNCTCRNQWSGNTCEVCEDRFNTQLNCGSCASGFESYPDCFLRCTNSNCSGRASSVVGNTNVGCNCTCINQFSGADCSICPENYDPVTGCISCAPGFGGPECRRLCTTEANCSGSNSWSVTGFADDSCDCVCRSGYGGAQCERCADGVVGADCSACGPDRFFFPDCLFCSIVENCSSNAVEVRPTDHGCECRCRNSWFGATCSFCPIRYDRFADCADCGLGFEGTYPDCQIGCSSFYNCSNNAERVTGGPSEGTNCTCFCRNLWEGDTCATCPHPYDPEHDCAACLPGYAPFPNCTKLPETPAPPRPPSPTPTPTPTPTIEVLPSRTREATRTPGPQPSVTPGPSVTPPIEPSRTPESEPSETQVPPPSPTVPPTPTSTWTVSLSTTHSECAQNASECMARNNSHSWPYVHPVDCFCVCMNNWTSMWCDYCPPRFNETEDCGNCSATFVLYPRCDHLLHVTGNWTFQVPAQYLARLERERLWETLAADLNEHINTTLNCTNSFNVTAIVMMAHHDTTMPDPEGRWFEFSVNIIDPEPDETNATAACIMANMTVPPFNSTPPTPRVNALIESLFPDVSPASVFQLLNNTMINTTDLPYVCELTDNWCINAAPPEEPPVTPSPFPWWIIVLVLLLLLLLALLLYYLLIVRPREQHAAKYKFNRHQLLKERQLSDAELQWCAAESSAQEERLGSRATKVFADSLMQGDASSVHLDDDDEEEMLARASGVVDAEDI